jgi:hypothetical protein
VRDVRPTVGRLRIAPSTGPADTTPITSRITTDRGANVKVQPVAANRPSGSRHRIVATLLAVLLALGGGHAGAADEHVDSDERQLEISDAVPEYGGLSAIHGEPFVTVWLTDNVDEATARAAADAYRDLFDVEWMDGLEVRPRQADHSWRDLVTWKRALTSQLDVDGTVTFDIAEDLNRVRLGILRSTSESEVRTQAEALGVPTSALIIFHSGPVHPDDGAGFLDVAPGSTHADAIDWLVGAGITRGHTDGTFRPTAEVSRAQVASFLDRALDLPTAGDPGFADVSFGGTHGQAIANLTAAGIVVGLDDGTFAPSAPVTRGQLASLIDRAMDVPGADLAADFPDVAPGSTHAAAIGNLSAAGIVGGFEDGTFRPSASVTRAQTASYLYRAAEVDAG